MQWLRLGFLAMLGLACATFLSFPVAALLSLTVLSVALSSGFVVESLGYYSENAPSAELGQATSPLRAAALFLAKGLADYGRFGVSEQVVDGRRVPWPDVLACAGWIGLLWTGLAGAAGWLVFRRRELGRVQV